MYLILLLWFRNWLLFPVNKIFLPISILFRYGYIDPQNNVREFSYKSGNPCDPETKQELNPDPSPDFGNTQKARFQSGNFDYTDNKFVLPSGKRGTLTVNKKNRARG